LRPRYELPFNGNGVLEQVANTLKQTSVSPIDVDDRSCIDFPDYITLGCSCWFIGTAACPATQPAFCRNCTKVGVPLAYVSGIVICQLAVLALAGLGCHLLLARWW
jgi:hypothetical protein